MVEAQQIVSLPFLFFANKPVRITMQQPMVSPFSIRLIGSILVGALLFYLAQPAYSAGCTDLYDANGATVDNLSNHPSLTTIPIQISRSLCGFYDADYVEFPAEPGHSYRINVLNHEDPALYGLYLELWEQSSPANYRLLLSTPQGVTTFDTPTAFTGVFIVRVGSVRSDTGAYGGGDYQLSIVHNEATQPTPTGTPSPQPTALPTATATVPQTATPTTAPTTIAQATPTTVPQPTAVATPTTAPRFRQWLPAILIGALSIRTV
jgi:hypothetical protein